jgi:hypothetical protein
VKENHEIEELEKEIESSIKKREIATKLLDGLIGEK